MVTDIERDRTRLYEDKMTTDTLVSGKIIHVSDKGWGFITAQDIPFTRIFFHWTGLEGDTLKFPDLRKGMKVEFKPIEMEGQGTRAIKIRVIDKPELFGVQEKVEENG